MRDTESAYSDYSEIGQFDTCELHDRRPLRFVCLDCEECCICDECCRFIHASHRKQEITEYNRTQLVILEDNRRRLTEATIESKHKIQSLTKQIERSRRKAVKAVKEATAAAGYLWEEIKRKRERLIQNIGRYTLVCSSQLGKQKEELHHRLKQYELIIKRIENVAKSDNQSEIFKDVGGLKKHCTGALNLNPFYSLPVYNPKFERNPNLLSDFDEVQIGVVLNSDDHSDNESEEGDYVIEEEDPDPWVYEVEPMPPVDSVSSSDGGDDHQDNTSAGSSYCQRAGAEVAVGNATDNNLSCVMPNCTDSPSAGLSEANQDVKHHRPEDFSEIRPGCSNHSSIGLGDASTFGLDCNKSHCQKEDFNQQQLLTGPTTTDVIDADKEFQLKEEPTRTSPWHVPLGQYSLARRTNIPKYDDSIHVCPITSSVSIDMDSETEVYESLQKNDTLPSMLLSLEKYDSLQGSTLSLDRIQCRSNLPQKFQLYFNKSKVIQTENTILSGRVLKRVFLPFTFTGFTTVSRENDMLLAFVTTDKEVVLLRRNGVEYSRITELSSPFDVGSSGSFPYSIYITDCGARPGEGSVRVYSCSGGYLDTFVGGLKAPRGIDISTEGHVFVCDQADKCVYGFSPKGHKTLRLNIGGQGFPLYVSSLSNRRLAVSDNVRDNLIIYDIAGKTVRLVKTRVHDLPCRGMCSEDVYQNVLFVVHPEGNILHVIRDDQHEVINLEDEDNARALVPMTDERGNVFVF